MKNVFLLLFFVTGISFAQNLHFKIENKEIFWEATFSTTDNDVLEQIDKTDKRVETNKLDNTGKGIRLFSICKLRQYTNDDDNEYKLSFDFKVTFDDNKYTVRVYNLNYIYDREYRVDLRKFNFSKKFSDKDQTILSTGNNHERLFECFEENFMKTFKTQNSNLVN
ncbi:hypothetical protein [Flavobacterium sp.]|uniref:hypothetical protein n=1 Tax=Flavobacterium sp. TaxID=239 RepID=UPI0037522E8D